MQDRCLMCKAGTSGLHDTGTAHLAPLKSLLAHELSLLLARKLLLLRRLLALGGRAAASLSPRLPSLGRPAAWVPRGSSSCCRGRLVWQPVALCSRCCRGVVIARQLVTLTSSLCPGRALRLPGLAICLWLPGAPWAGCWPLSGRGVLAAGGLPPTCLPLPSRVLLTPAPASAQPLHRKKCSEKC